MTPPRSYPVRLAAAVAAGCMAWAGMAQAQTQLNNIPVFSALTVPGNLALTLSVEYPTAVSNTHQDTTYSANSTYIGYFDPAKCYTYTTSTTEANRFFQPAGKATAHVCSGKWSGNFLNWATMQTIDPFRWALTGGYRSIDDTTKTVIEKAYASGQGGSSNFPDRTMSDANTIKGATPFSWSTLNLRIQGLGNKLWFSNSLGLNNTTGKNAYTVNPVAFTDGANKTDVVYEVSVRARVCDNTSGNGGVESNCVLYSNGQYKPEGLIQQYSQKIRFSAFGYLNDATLSRDGGVLRARMKFVGPTKPVAGGDAQTNTAAEWSSTTGIMVQNPDTQDVTDTNSNYGITIADSGVMNYLNKFGKATNNYKTYDPVGELYYAALRYFRNLGNVPEWTNASSSANKTTYADGFPVITNWGDPVLYSCQKNFILGIGDVNSHADRDLPGATGNSEPSTQPSAVTADYTSTGLDSVAWTNKVGTLQGIANLGTIQTYNGCCNNNGALMAGLAYYANTQDIRTDLSGKQTIKTYWLDVQEYQKFVANNQFYLAAKYGGFTVPTDYNVDTITAAKFTDSWWHTGPATDKVGSQLRPDTYYTAAKADTMVSGLATAFASIAADVSAYTSSLNFSGTLLSTSTATYGSTYDSATWAGDIEAKTPSSVGDPITYNTPAWKFAAQLQTQMGTDGAGWDTRRYIVTYNPTTKKGVPFRLSSLAAAQQTALDPTWTVAADAGNYLNWLRGDQSQEQSSTTTNSTKLYRDRNSAKMVGDIINSGVTVMGPVTAYLSEAGNPGFNAHVTNYGSRPNILIAGANTGLVHIINGTMSAPVGSATDNRGKELFAFIPNAAFLGPNNTPSVDGLAAVGNPDYDHHFLVDAKPAVGDVDFKKTQGSTLTNNEWHSIVVGGLGKGGRSLYALDLTSANSVSSETNAATRVLWEYTDSDMGFTYGTPVITKTAKYGWVVIAGTGMNTTTGKGAFVILNARTGALLEKVWLPTVGGSDKIDNGTPASPAGLSYLTPFYPDALEGTIETVYAGDLNGNLWRLDLTAATGNYPDPVKIAKLTGASASTWLPVTSAPTVGTDTAGRRWVSVGTGRLLATDDLKTVDRNRLFALRDGYKARYAQTSDLPSGVTLPVMDNTTRHDLQDISTTAGALATNKAGFFIDTYVSTGSGVDGYRFVSAGDNYGNLVAMSAILPVSSDPCNSTGITSTYKIDLASGTITRVVNNFVVLSTQFVRLDDGTVGLALGGKPAGGATGTAAVDGSGKTAADIACQKAGNCKRTDGDTVDKSSTGGSGDSRLINWREIPLRN